MLHFEIICVEDKKVISEQLSESDILSLIKILYTSRRNVTLGELLIRFYEKVPNSYDELRKVLP